MKTSPACALIVGAGTGLGASLARRFSRAEMNVVMARRNVERIDTLAAELSGIGHRTVAMACDATDEHAVETLFATVRAEFGTPRLVVYNASGAVRKGVLDSSAEEFERSWRAGCYGGFLVGRAAARAMLADAPAQGGHAGTILFTGATASLRGSAGFQNMAVGKFGLRALSQSMARELQARGIHVAHVVIDGQIRSGRPGYSEAERGRGAVLDPDAIAEAYWQLHVQPLSTWTLELDLRPWVEKF